MRFMVNEDSEAGRLPDEQELKAMGKFNDELVKAEGRAHPLPRGQAHRGAGSLPGRA